MKSIKVIFGTHNNQPIGNIDYINEKVYSNAYKPFLRTLYFYPDFTITLHFSGILLQWIEDKHPEYFMLLDEMVKRKQIELLGGGFYEPILPIISNSDKFSQIELLTTYLRSHFGKRPRGCWVTERVWEPYLASIFTKSGMEYIFLDDDYFINAGLCEDDCFYPYLTEDQGSAVAVFPISSKLKAMVGRDEPEAVIQYLDSIADEKGNRVVCLIDNGEKLGDWPDTSKQIYEGKWLERFIELILKNSDWIETIQPGKYLKRYETRPTVYLNSMVYKKMEEWLRSPIENRDLNTNTKNANNPVSGNLFRRYLTKYPEINLLYSKMNYVNMLINQIRGDKYKKKASKEELWKGQCNCVYWHGDFDGIYSNHLRKEVYKSLIEAEKLTRDDGLFLPSIIDIDFENDGKKEFLYQGKKLNAYIHMIGGILFELDWLPASWNYLDTMSRYKESYHDIIARHNGYDRYLRKAVIDHFFNLNTDINDFKSMHYYEAGDFIENPYNIINADKERFALEMYRLGNIKVAGRNYAVNVTKKYTFDTHFFSVSYEIMNLSGEPLNVEFAVENNFALAASGSNNWNSLRINNNTIPLADNILIEEDLNEVKIRDLRNKVEINITSVKNFRLWAFPVETFSNTLNQLNKIYQASCFVLAWPLKLEPEQTWQTGIKIEITDF